MERPDPSSLPVTPGVYLYKDAGGRIIYVGKARNLRKRVLSYFRPEQTLPRKTVAMLSHAERLETLSTGTEKEALLLEASLIKKHRPHYNIVLRDDKQYVLFRLDRSADFPRLEIVRQTRRDGARYFGPFTSGLAARETWKSIHRTFPLRRCTDRAFRNRVRPCLYHHLGQCLAPCVGSVTPEDYAQIVQRVELLLAGRSKELVNGLGAAMLAASEALDFERAAQLRDQIRAVERTLERQSVVLPEGGDMDVLGVATLGREAGSAPSGASDFASGDNADKNAQEGRRGLGLGVLFIREGRLVDGRTFFWPGLDLEDGPELVGSFLSQFYGPHSAIPPRIVVPWLPLDPREIAGSPEPAASPASDDEAPGLVAAAVSAGGETGLGALEALLRELRGGVVRIALPRNRAELGLVDMAGDNAREAGRRQVETDLGQKLARVFGAPVPVQRIECVDVSHTGGQDTRVGMVVFEQGKPLKSAFRSYRVAADTPDTTDTSDTRDTADTPDGSGAPLAPCASAAPVSTPVSRPVSPARVPEDSPENSPENWPENWPENAPDGFGGDDYAALAAWVGRRLESGPPWADLVLVDGGRGQVSAVYKAAAAWLERARAAEQGAAPPGAEASAPGQQVRLPFLLAGIAKARDERGHADRRAGNLRDRIFVPGRSNPLPLREGSPELLFLQHVRDSAHRFAIGRHRQARAKSALSGELLRIPGVGMATAKRLWEHFPTLEAILQADEAELAAIPGIGRARAGRLAARLANLAGARRRE